MTMAKWPVYLWAMLRVLSLLTPWIYSRVITYEGSKFLKWARLKCLATYNKSQKISNSIHTNLYDKQVCQRGRYVSELNIKGSWATMAQPPWNPWNPRRHLTSDFIHPWFVIHQKNGNSTILHLLCHWSANYMTFFISSILRVQYSTCTTWIILQFSIKCYITYHTTTPI